MGRKRMGHLCSLLNPVTKLCILAAIISTIMGYLQRMQKNLLTTKIFEMRKIFLAISICFLLAANAQETVYPAKENKGITFIKNATIHVGNGKVIENGII